LYILNPHPHNVFDENLNRSGAGAKATKWVGTRWCQATRRTLKHTTTWRWLALEAVERFDEALEQYRTDVRLAPENPQRHTNPAVFLFQTQGRRELAIKHFRAALQLDPNNSDALENLRHPLDR
jgi:tetratricopeptide (TPR) repeat protein